MNTPTIDLDDYVKEHPETRESILTALKRKVRKFSVRAIMDKFFKEKGE